MIIYENFLSKATNFSQSIIIKLCQPVRTECSSRRVVYLDSVAMNRRGARGRGRAWQGACVTGGVRDRGRVRGRRDDNCSERYASYWTAFLLVENFKYCVRCSCNMKTNPTYSLIAQRKGSFNGKKPTCVRYQVTHRSGNRKKLKLQSIDHEAYF